MVDLVDVKVTYGFSDIGLTRCDIFMGKLLRMEKNQNGRFMKLHQKNSNIQIALF